MLRVLRIPLADDDVRGLTATLLAEGSPDARSAATMLTKGIDRDLYAVALTRPGVGRGL